MFEALGDDCYGMKITCVALERNRLYRSVWCLSRSGETAMLTRQAVFGYTIKAFSECSCGTQSRLSCSKADYAGIQKLAMSPFLWHEKCFFSSDLPVQS